MRIRSAVDGRSVVFICTVVAAMFAGALYLSKTMGFSPGAAAMGYTCVALASLFILWFLFGTYYELRESGLYCKSGPFAETISYDRIVSAQLSRCTRASMAPLSVRRIEITCYCGGPQPETMLISPVNRELFLRRLEARCVEAVHPA